MKYLLTWRTHVDFSFQLLIMNLYNLYLSYCLSVPWDTRDISSNQYHTTSTKPWVKRELLLQFCGNSFMCT